MARRGGLSTTLLLGALLLTVVGTFSAWTAATDSPDGYVEAAWAATEPTNDSPPEISGIERDGETLTATEGDWSGSGQPFDYDYRWTRCDAAGASCTDIPGEDGTTYVATPDDVQPGGLTIRACVTATNANGATTACSDPSGPIQAMPAEISVAPSISGTAHENQTLTAEGSGQGTPPLAHSYEWLRCDAAGDDCSAIPGATGSSYVLAHDDGGATIRVTITVSNSDLPGGDAADAISDPTEVATAISESPQAQWATDGISWALTRDDDTTYIGGAFSMVGRPTGSLARMSISTGSADTAFPAVSGGDIRAMEPDGSGGWFIGGTFTRIGSVARSYAAHILADGTLDTGWNANVDSPVASMSLGGTTLYMGGYFSNVGGQARNRAAAVSAGTGAVTTWNANIAVGTTTVFSVLYNGTTVYIGGSFTTVGGQARPNFAEVNATTGALAAFNPAPNSVVYVMRRTGSVLYMGGAFSQISGQTRNRAASFNTATGVLTGWNPNLNSTVFTMVVPGPTAYLGGTFTTVGGASHPSLVGVNTTGGTVTWNPLDPTTPFVGAAPAQIWTLSLSGSTLYVGGNFTLVGGVARRGLASFNTTTGGLNSWAPQSSALILASGISGSTFYAGGGNTTGASLLMNTILRSNAAAFDTDGAPTGWAPNPTAAVRALQEANGVIYMGGDFSNAGGQSRTALAAVNTTNGAATSWNPGGNGTVNALAIRDSTLYVGGNFTTVGGQSRTRLAEVALSSGAVTAWNPSANSAVSAIALSESTIYVGGGFTTIGGQSRTALASFDIGSSVATSWNPGVNSTVNAIHVAPWDTIYVGGGFTVAGGQTRHRLAAFTPGSDTATSWNPMASGGVWAIGGMGGDIWVGGFFATVGGEARSNVAGLRASDGTATGWDPGFLSSGLRALLVDDTGVHLGGEFSAVGERVAPGYMHFP